MAATSEARALPFFTDLIGQPLESGFIYIGQAGLDPVAYPAVVYSDIGNSTVLAQPIRTTHGHAVSAGQQVHIFCQAPYSILVRDASGRQVYLSLNEVDPVSTVIGNAVVASVDSYNSLRARSKSSTYQVWVTNIGMYIYDASDTTSPEVIPTTIVGNDGARYKLNQQMTQTQGQGDISNFVANTEWVSQNTTGISRSINRTVGISATTVLSASDGGTQFMLAGSGYTVVLPHVAGLPSGWRVAFTNTTLSSSFDIAPQSGELINCSGFPGGTFYRLAKQWSHVQLFCDGAAWYASDETVAGNLGYTPVQQGTGTSQLSNPVKLGWDGASLRATVDTTDLKQIPTVSALQANGVGALALGSNTGPNPAQSGTWVQTGTANNSVYLWVRTA